MGVWECGSVGVWECGSVGVWECGSVGVWECGSVGERYLFILAHPIATTIAQEFQKSIGTLLVLWGSRGSEVRSPRSGVQGNDKENLEFSPQNFELSPQNFEFSPQNFEFSPQNFGLLNMHIHDGSRRSGW